MKFGIWKWGCNKIILLMWIIFQKKTNSLKKFKQIETNDNSLNIEDERRLVYIAITRDKKITSFLMFIIDQWKMVSFEKEKK